MPWVIQIVIQTLELFLQFDRLRGQISDDVIENDLEIDVKVCLIACRLSTVSFHWIARASFPTWSTRVVYSTCERADERQLRRLYRAMKVEGVKNQRRRREKTFVEE